MAKKIAMMQLASCWGCHQSLLDAHLTLLHVLPELSFVYWPAVVDFKTKDLENLPDGSVDVGFLEGFCRTEHDIENAKLLRRKCKIVVAIGSCAVLGGVPGMANLFTLEELEARKFMDEEFVDPGSVVPTENVPKNLDAIPDLHTVVKIDVDLPGCPPKTGNIIGLIASVLGQVDNKIDTSKSMCEVCPLGTCLLDEGKLCYGPITAVCDPIGKLASGHPVLGEFGLTPNIHAANAEKLFSKITAQPLSKEEVRNTVEALMMMLGGTPLGFLAKKADAVRRIRLDPDSLTMKLANSTEIVDFKLDGYPEMLNHIIGAAMGNLKSNPLYDDSAQTVCTSCERNLKDKEVVRYIRDYEGIPDQDTCFLLQGYVCMGPLTAPGCGATCPRANSPCLGCYGPASNVDDYVSKATSYFPSICKDTPENITAFFKDTAGLFGRFCIPTSKLGHKMADTKSEES